jgi:tRNA threonylcarbamoyladenosine biosynthesis protein TsaB
MKILAIDTSFAACSIALQIEDKISVIHNALPLQQAQFILPLLEKLLAKHNIALNQLNAIAFGCGPGSFTGVRIAASVAQGLAYAMQLPVIPISSLAALAQAAYEKLKWKKLLVGMDARMQEVYWGAYAVDEQGRVSLVNREIVCTPEQVIIPNGDWYGVGNAWEVYPSQMTYQPLDVTAASLTAASAILTLAEVKYVKKEWVTAKEALPVYLRDIVAKKTKKS